MSIASWLLLTVIIKGFGEHQRWEARTVARAPGAALACDGTNDSYPLVVTANGMLHAPGLTNSTDTRARFLLILAQQRIVGRLAVLLSVGLLADAACRLEPGSPVRVPQVAQDHPRTLVRRVDKLAIADIDPSRRQARLAGILEKHQIARLELMGINRASAGCLSREASWLATTGDLIHDVVDEAGAVEASRGRPAPGVRAPQILQRVRRDLTSRR